MRAWCGMDTAFNYLVWGMISVGLIGIGFAVMVW